MKEISYIYKNFLIKNGFTEATVGAGSFPWTYEDKRYRVTINQWVDCGTPWIFIINYENNHEMKFSTSTKITKEDLHRCIQFMQVPDEFNYE